MFSRTNIKKIWKKIEKDTNYKAISKYTIFLDVYGSSVGLLITQSMGLTGLIQWGMRQSAELENQMTSVERVLEFTHVEHEPELESVRILMFVQFY